MNARALAVTVLASVLVASSASAQEVTLRLGLAENARWRLAFTQTQRVFDGDAVVETSEQRQELTLTVRAPLSGGGALVVLRVDRLRVVTRSQDGTEQVVPTDTRHVNKDIVYRLSARGELLAVESVDGQVLSELPPAERDRIATIFGGHLVISFLAALAPLPEGAVAPGATWVVEQVVPDYVETRVTNRLAAVDADGTVTITQTGTTRADGPACEIATTIVFAEGMIRSSRGTVVVPATADEPLRYEMTCTRERLE